MATSDHLIYLTGLNDGMRYRVFQPDGTPVGPTRSVPNTGGTVVSFDAKPLTASAVAISWIARSGTTDTVYVRTFATDPTGALVGMTERTMAASWTTQYCDGIPDASVSSCPSEVLTLSTEATSVSIATTTDRVYVLHALRRPTTWNGSTFIIDPGYSQAGGAEGYALQVSAHRTSDLAQEAQFYLPFSTWRMAWGSEASAGTTIENQSFFAVRQPTSSNRGICIIGIPTTAEDEELIELDCMPGNLRMPRFTGSGSRGLLLARRDSPSPVEVDGLLVDATGRFISEAGGSPTLLSGGLVDTGRRRFDSIAQQDGWTLGLVRDGRWVTRQIQANGDLGPELVGPSVVVDTAVSIGRAPGGPLIAASGASASHSHRLHSFGCFGD